MEATDNPVAKTMPQIFPAPISEQTSGFSLVEVIVATAVTAMAIAAASTSLLTSLNVEKAGEFYRDAMLETEIVHARQYGLIGEDIKSISPSTMQIEDEMITSDEAARDAVWHVYTVRSTETHRRASFSIHGDATP
jgi:prepilin-type N-terminal cleavage/methylation domain-containing protein